MTSPRVELLISESFYSRKPTPLVHTCDIDQNIVPLAKGQIKDLVSGHFIDRIHIEMIAQLILVIAVLAISKSPT